MTNSILTLMWQDVQAKIVQKRSSLYKHNDFKQIDKIDIPDSCTAMKIISQILGTKFHN